MVQVASDTQVYDFILSENMRLSCRYILSLLLSVLVMVAGAQEDNDKAARDRAVEYFYLHAVSLFEQDSVDAAYEMLEHCLALDPESSPVKYELAAYYQFMGKDSIAREMLESIVREEPSNMRYCDALVAYYERHGDTESAIDVYERLLNDGTHGSKPEIYQVLYKLYSSIGENRKALEMLEKVEILEGPSESISLYKVYQYVMLQDSVNAIAESRRMIAEYPDNQLYRNMLGESYLHFNDVENAENAFIAALLNDPDDVMAMSSLASIYLYNDNDSLFCGITERMLKSERLEPEQRSSLLLDYVAHREKSDTAYMKGFFQELLKLPFDQVEIAEIYAQYLIYHQESNDVVIPVVERILELDPENNAALLQMLKYAIERNDYEDVVKRCDDALLYMPDMLALYYYKGLALYLLGDKDALLPVYELGLQHCGDDDAPETVSEMYTMVGDMYHEVGNLEKCMAAYDSALVYNPENINVLNNYAYYLTLEGIELDRALEMSEKTIGMEPDNAIYIDTYAWVLFALERYEEAKAYALKLLSTDSEKSSVEYNHCGDIFAQCGDIDRAVELWKKAEELGDDSKILKKKIKKRRYYPDGKKKRR